MTRAPPRTSGFTLIEMVVALALVGLVSLVLLQGLRLAAAGLDHVSRAADRLDDRTGLDALLRRALAAAVPLPTIGGQPCFVGEPERVSFVTMAEDGGAGLYRIELALADPQTRRDLVLTRALAAPLAVLRRQRSVVAEHVRGFRLAYFGATAPSEAPRWHDRWEGLAAPPLLVKVTLDRGGGDAGPPIVIRLWGAS